MKYSLPALFLISVLLPTSVPQDGLAADGRVATITSTQGTTLARPVGRERWTLLRPTSLLVPGDQIRTSSRGANAAELGLAGGGKLIVGPGSLIEIPKKGQIKLYRGDFEIVGSKKSELQVNGPGGYSETITGKKILRVTKEKVLQLNTPPQWLTGYRSSTTDEWMGSLLAKVDGRDVPLSVGYHKVDAVIRDQIAQTTIEQSFVNSTQETLEGVFYFPLPADASISGFGMWIDGELVEADIVERQRARQIYEDILRRKKDPGLLEWSGGNLFKARVYPILPRAEKRIRIRYTQVLPLEGSTVRYRYALRSDLLRQHPLRQLQIKVSVFSTLELASVTSTNHTCRARKTAHAATLEYDAEEYSPTSDFEASIKLKTLSNLTVVPHRRGNDGYFMLLLHPPGQNQAGWQRELMPERDKLDLVLVADTSGSMNAAARKTQADFLAGVLAMLGAEDQFRLMTCDVSARWFRDLPAAATEENAEAALAWLDRRPSLGWTNLDRAFASVGKTLQPNTLVIYVGDGIGTTGDCDPVKLAQRIARLETSGSTFHAVSTSNTYEKIVLEAIAHKGGGSVRRAGKKPAETAFRLLSEAAQPSVKNLTVTFEGLRTARVYPETLPHLPVGHQQTVLGRFLPGEGTQSGQVVVTGNLGGKPIRYATEVSIHEDEEGNSFLPRLWARQHLDALLTRGRSAAAKQEVVSLSQEYDIITPFTSFLVLKNDEERKRYGIARRVKMRDGEAIFAQARDRAAVEVLRQQMKEAHAWRMRLRARMLEEIGALGRDHIDGSIAYATTTEKLGFPKLSHASSSPFESSMLNSAIGLGGGGGGKFGARYGGAPGPRGAPISGSNTFLGMDAGGPELMEFEVAQEMSKDRAGTERLRQVDKNISGPSTPGPAGPGSLLEQSKRLQEEYGQGGQASNLPFSVLAYRVPPTHSTGLSHFGFPHLAVKPPEEETGFETPAWAEDILTLLRRIDRRPSLRSLQAGLRLNSTGGTVHSLHGQLLSQHTSSTVYTPGRWYKWNHGRGAQPSESWLTATQRGTLAAALRLGRVRQAQEGDQRSFGFALPDFSMTNLVRTYRHHRASIKSHSDSTVVISLRPSASSPWETRLHIDTNKNVILGLEEFSSGRPTGSTRFTGHTEIAGSWWPKLTETLDRQGRVIWRQEMAVTAASSDEVDLAIAKAMSEHGDVIFVNAKVPRLAASKQAVHAGKADLLNHLHIADHYRNSQQWDRVWQAWEAAEALSNNKPGALWIRARILTDSRRGEEAKRWFQELANITSSTKDANRAVFLASHLRGLAGAIVNNNEENTLSENLKPTYFAQGKDRAWRERQWQHWQANLLGRQNRHEDAERIYAAILREHPRDVGALLGELRALTVIGKSDAALALAAERLEPDQRWLPEEAGRIYEFWTDLLWQQRKQADLRRVLDQWVARADETKTAYGRWLSLFLYEDKEELANAWVRDRFAEKAQPSDPIQMARLNAATQLALGKGWGFHAQRVIDLWHQPLATLAATSARSDDPILLGLANQILSNTGYRKTSAFAATKRKLLGELMADKAIEEMHGPRLAAYLGWLSWGKSQVEESTWTKIVSRLHARWKATEDPDLRQQLGGELLKLFDAYEAKKQALVFLRAWKNSTTARYRPQVTRILLERLIKEGWTAEIETELFTLIPDLLTQNMSDQQRRHTVAGSIRWLAKNLESMRKKELLGPVEKLETLPRTQRDTKTASAEKAARKALASTFHTQAKASDDLAARWMQIESLGFATQAGENPKKIAGAVRELLLEIPDSKDHDTHRVLRERCCVTLAHASAQGGTGASVISEALATYQDGYKQNPGSLN
ncbi:MAG: VIT domain-containing protein, partial [Planctomycetota bacterium]|nr:VIT domain-containing protein [Planctomycetota bacterium]